MNEYIFQAEAVSPLFIGGVNQEADFSAASLKGALRFWFRALKGAILYSSGNDHNQVVEKLSESEADIFGSTSKAGIVFLDVEPKNAMKQSFQGKVNGITNYPLVYSGYGLQGTRENPNPREGYKTNSTFTVRVLFSKPDEQKEKMVLDSLFLLSVFGNLGARGSRGFGSVMFTKTNGTASFRTLEGNSLEEAISKNLSSIISEYKIKKPQVTPAFPVISSPDFFKYKVYKKYSPGKEYEIIANFGKQLRGFRENKQEEAHRRGVFHSYDYQAVKMKKTSDAKDNIFGLPRNFSFSDEKFRKAEIKITNDLERRNSPLKLKLIKFNGGLFPVVVLFISDFLPPGTKLSVQQTGHPLNIPPFSRAEDFIKKLKEGGF